MLLSPEAFRGNFFWREFLGVHCLFYLTSLTNLLQCEPMTNDIAINEKLTVEFCRRSPAGAWAFIASTFPLMLFPLVTEKPYYYFSIGLLLAIIPTNLVRFFLARKIMTANTEGKTLDEKTLLAHTAAIILNALFYGLYIGLSFWALPLKSFGFLVSVIVMSAITAGSTSSLVLDPFIQSGFLILAAVIPNIELLMLSLFRPGQGYAFIAILLFIYIAYLFAHSRQYYKKMRQLYEYEERLLTEKTQLEIIVDELKRAQEEILTQKARADHAARLASIGEMASGIAHEINNPLSIIQGNLRHIQTLLDETTLNEPSRSVFEERSEKIQNAVRRIGRIINGLKLFSMQRKDSAHERVPFKMIIGNTLELCAEKFHLNHIKLEINEPPADDVHINIAEITQVLMHLMNNAFDAVVNTANPVVKIETKIRKNFLVVSVRDNGIGIPDDIKNRIFIPFFTSKEVGKGPGLGLSISRGIIEQHGGTLYLQEGEEAAHWTTFVFTLPLA